MSTMNTFHKWLSAADRKTNSYQSCLALLTQASRNQVQELKSNINWTIWW